jgi:nicotinamide-nucleotide amidase
MSIEIIAIGDEVLKGITLNTNAAFIAKALSHLGYLVSQHTVLPDDPEILVAGLEAALERASLVIATGGLGPTCDDITQEAAAKLFTQEPKLLDNRIGSAKGLIFSAKGKTLALLPGVPQEMKPMFENEFIPILPDYLKLEKKLISELVHFGSLSENQVDPMLRKMKAQHPEMDFGIYPGYGILSVRLTSSKKEDIEDCKAELQKAFADLLFEDSEGKLEHAVHTLFLEKELKLAVAESCTGGMIAAKITSIPGASNYFLGSLVTYSDDMKQTVLHVKKETLQKFGAVSKECVLEMAAGLLKISNADYVVATSGIAGPDGGSKEKPVGTVWLSIAKKEGFNEAIHMQLKGNRETITLWAAQSALFLLWKKVSGL